MGWLELVVIGGKVLHGADVFGVSQFFLSPCQCHSVYLFVLDSFICTCVQPHIHHPLLSLIQLVTCNGLQQVYHMRLTHALRLVLVPLYLYIIVIEHIHIALLLSLSPFGFLKQWWGWVLPSLIFDCTFLPLHDSKSFISLLVNSINKMLRTFLGQSLWSSYVDRCNHINHDELLSFLLISCVVMLCRFPPGWNLCPCVKV